MKKVLAVVSVLAVVTILVAWGVNESISAHDMENSLIESAKTSKNDTGNKNSNDRSNENERSNEVRKDIEKRNAAIKAEYLADGIDLDVIKKMTGKPLNFDDLEEGIINLDGIKLAPGQTLLDVIDTIDPNYVNRRDRNVTEWWDTMEIRDENDKELQETMRLIDQLVKKINKIEEKLATNDLSSQQREKMENQYKEIDAEFRQAVNISINLKSKTKLDEHEHDDSHLHEH